MELISIIKDLLSLRFLHSLAQLRAIGWIIIHPQIISNRRAVIKKIRKISDEELLDNTIFSKSIVYQYFINNKKEYSSL
jgi:hypothetical protein